MFNYTAAVKCAHVNAAHDANFGWTIPDGHLYAGTDVTATVHDGGSSGVGQDNWRSPWVRVPRVVRTTRSPLAT